MSLVDVAVSTHLTAVEEHLLANGIAARIGAKPHDAGWQGGEGISEFVPYCVIWRIGAVETRNQTMDTAYIEARPSVQVTCWGANPGQVDALVDDVLVLMLNGSLSIPGRRVQRVSQEVGITTTRNPDESPNELYYGGARFRIWTLPEANPE